LPAPVRTVSEGERSAGTNERVLSDFFGIEGIFKQTQGIPIKLILVDPDKALHRTFITQVYG